MQNGIWALITGASSGIGEATAKTLAAEGYNLFLVARRVDRLEKIKGQIEKEFSVQIKLAQLDLAKSDEIEAFVHLNRQALSSVQVLINNAGLAAGADLAQNAKWSDWKKMLDVNISGLMALTQAMLPILLEQPDAHIVNMGSVAGKLVYPGGAVYCASKFAVRAFSEGLRMDLLGKPLRISLIEPGMVETEFSEVRFSGDLERAQKVYAGMKPLTADDIAATIKWVLTQPKHVNIQEVVIFPTDQASVGHVFRRS